jgi:hypothetical protein
VALAIAVALLLGWLAYRQLRADDGGESLQPEIAAPESDAARKGEDIE